MSHKWSNPSSHGLDQRRAGAKGKVRHVPLTPELREQYETKGNTNGNRR